MSRVSWVCFRVYSPAIVLAVWALTWALGATGVKPFWLILLAVAAIVAERERIRQRRRLREEIRGR